MADRNKEGMKYETFASLYKGNSTKVLTERAKELKLTNYSKLKKKELVLAIMEAEMEKAGKYCMGGVLGDVLQGGYGSRRTVSFSRGEKDTYIPAPQIRRFGLRKGDKVAGKVRKRTAQEK